jgi:hypothetical protein
MKIFCDYFVMKCKMSSSLYIYFESPKDLPLVSSWNLRHVDFLKNSHNIYNKLLFRLYASMNCVTSQFVITPFPPFSAHTLMRAHILFSKQSTTHRPTSHFFNRRGCSCFSYLANTYIFVSLWMVSVANVSPLVDSVGPQINLASLVKRHWPWYSPRVIVQSNFTEFFVCHFSTTWIVQ